MKNMTKECMKSLVLSVIGRTEKLEI